MKSAKPTWSNIRPPELDSRGKRKRHVKFFDRKKDADAFHAQVRVDVGKGVHVPVSKSITVEAAGRGWIDSCGDLERTTVDGYQQHLNLHINPYLGGLKDQAISVPIVRDRQDKLRKGVPAPGQAQAEPRTADMVKRVTTSLGSLIADAVERGHARTNVVRSLRASRKRGKERKAERRAKGRLKVGVDIPTPSEIEAILGCCRGAGGVHFCSLLSAAASVRPNCGVFPGRTWILRRPNFTFASAPTLTIISGRPNRNPASG